MDSPQILIAAYEAASRSHDIGRLVGMIHENAVYFFSNEAVHQGKTEVLAAIRHNFEMITAETYAISNLTWLIETSDAATCVYDYAWSGLIKGQPASGSGRGTSVMQNSKLGWQIIHEHLSRGAFAS